MAVSDPFDYSTVRTVTTGLRFPEGPIALDDGSVLVSEIEGGALNRVLPDGSQHPIDCGGGVNGAALGAGWSGLRLQRRWPRLQDRGRHPFPVHGAPRGTRAATSNGSTSTRARWRRCSPTSATSASAGSTTSSSTPRDPATSSIPASAPSTTPTRSPARSVASSAASNSRTGWACRPTAAGSTSRRPTWATWSRGRWSAPVELADKRRAVQRRR